MGRELPRWLTGKESACQCRRHRRQRFSPWVRKIPWRRKWQPTPVFLPGKSHGQRSLVGHGPQGHKESDTTELLSVRAHTHTPLGRGPHGTLTVQWKPVAQDGVGVGWRWEGDKKPKLAALGYRRSRNYSGKSSSFLVLVQPLSTFPSPLSSMVSCKISCISLSFSPQSSIVDLTAWLFAHRLVQGTPQF